MDSPSEWFLKKMFYPVAKRKALALDETQESFRTTLTVGKTKKVSLIDLLGPQADPADIEEYFFLIKAPKQEASSLLN